MIDYTNFSNVSGVYKFTNTINGKIYIGSSVDVRRRICHHLRQLKNGNHNNQHLLSAWRKYGEEAFTCEIIILAEPKDLLTFEQKFMDEYKSSDKHFGYNKAPYAKNTLGYKFTEEQIAKMKAIHNTPEYKEKCSERSKQMWTNPLYKAKMIKLLKERWQNPEYVKRMSDIGKEKWANPLFLQLIMESQKINIEQWVNACQKWWSQPENQQQMKKHHKQLWSNPDYRESIIKSQKAGWTDSKKKKQSEALKRYYANLTPEAKQQRYQKQKNTWASYSGEEQVRRTKGFRKRWNRNNPNLYPNID